MAGFLTVFLLHAGEIKYPVSAIPAALSSGARMVVRYESHDFEVVSQKEAVERITLAITFLTDKSIEDSKMFLPYHKYTKIRQVRAVVYNAAGLLVKKVSGDEIIDVSGIDGFTLYDDNRIKIIDPGYRTIPFTVEFSWEEICTGLLNGPVWSPYKGSGCSVQESRFTLTWPDNITMRFLEQGNAFGQKDSSFETKKIRTWTASWLPAYREEIFSRPESELVPMVFTAPNEFEIGGYPGNMETWNGFGMWIQSLNKDKGVLSPETKDLIKKMTEGLPDNRSKAKKIYEYFQNRTRYVNIAVGMGGWQPIPAEQVDRVCYGDCKALSNYLHALLTAAGVESCYTLVRAGREESALRTEFPSNQFNHAILCIPEGKDTLWLECTSQYIPFGYLGSFTDDRDALVIGPDGGKIVRTPLLSAADNLKMTQAVVEFDQELYAKADVRIRYGGVYYDEMMPVIHSDMTDRKKMLTELISIPHFELIDVSLEDHRERKPFVDETVVLNMENYCSVMGSKILLPLNLASRLKDKSVNPATRKTELFFRRGKRVSDTIVYKIPEAFLIESLPAAVSIDSPFGNYAMRADTMGQQITYTRSLELKKGKFPASSAKEFDSFYLSVQRYDNAKAVLKRKEN